MKLNVLNVAFPFAPVGKDAVGGAEQVLSSLDAALVQAGHTSVVAACQGSTIAGRLVGTPVPDGRVTEQVRGKVWETHKKTIERAIERYRPDLVHMHGIDFYRYLPDRDIPMLITLHLPPSWYPPEVFDWPRPNMYLNCVSASQTHTCPEGTVTLLPSIENGVDCGELRADLPPGVRKGGFAVSLGRICPEKNFHTALSAGRAAGIPVLLGGKVFGYQAHESYFTGRILPLLDKRRRFIGAVSPRMKRLLLTTARCLLVPSLAPETSSLVAMESLACGTPVVAFPAGALPDIVEHGVTGFIVENPDEMAEAIRETEHLDPEICRTQARRRFSLERTIQQYFDIYTRLAQVSGRPAGA